MELILKNADFSENGIVEPVSATLEQGRINILEGIIQTGTTSSYNRTVDTNYYMRRTKIKNTGSAAFSFMLMFYDANKNYIGYSTTSEDGEEAASLTYKLLNQGETASIYDFVRYLDVSGGEWSSTTFDPKDAKYFRIVISNGYSSSFAAEISK